MNELLFFSQIILIVGFALGALKLGKEALISWIVVQVLVANLFVLKQITLFGFDVTASDAFIVGSLLGLNFLQEYYSKEDAQKSTWICFFFMFFFALISQLHLLYKPSAFDTTHPAFVSILSLSPRLFLASMTVFFIVQRIDIYFFAFLKKSLPSLHFAFRAAIALIVSQFLDTVLFGFAGLYGIVGSIFDVIVMSFLVKLVVIGFTTSVLRLRSLVNT